MSDHQLNPTPKSRFQATDANLKAHHEMLATPAFQRAEDLALLNYGRNLSDQMKDTANPQVLGMVNAWKLAGVHEFLHEFRILAEKPVEMQPPGKARTLNNVN